MQAQGAVTNAKEDTVFYGDSGLGDLWVDQSQFDTDLTEDATCYESPSSRAALTGATGRELYVRLPVDPSGGESIILIHADPSDVTSHTYQIKYEISGELTFSQNNTQLAAVTLSLAGSTDISIHWSTRPNPLTTGGSNAVVSEIIVYDHDSDAYVTRDFVSVAHAISTTSTSWALGVGGWWDGSVMKFSSPNPSKCRIGRAFHTSVEMAEDWVATRAVAPKVRPQNFPVLGPIDPDAGFGNESEWAGAANAGYAKRIAQTSTSAMRYAPLLNEVYSDPMTYRLIGSVDSPQWMLTTKTSDRVYRDVTKLRFVQLPRTQILKAATSVEPPYVQHVESGQWPRLRVRVHVQSWVTSGASVHCLVECTGMSRPPTWEASLEVGDDPPPYAAKTISNFFDVDHGSSGVGEWIDIGTLDPNQDQIGVAHPIWGSCIYLCLGWGIAPLGGELNEANARMKIKAWQVIPEWPDAWEIK